ncbi:hypothetical protein [Streptomyces sp. NPDC006856]|uniref:hypothetical protein n=1 Tax=Streptomyces sp. NPDC006856 TaxID=3364766 RepID=UPI0036988022
MPPLTGLVTRLREARADSLAAAAALLFKRASDLYETTDADSPQANRHRSAAHRIAARAERLAARSYRWRPARPYRITDDPNNRARHHVHHERT